MPTTAPLVRKVTFATTAVTDNSCTKLFDNDPRSTEHASLDGLVNRFISGSIPFRDIRNVFEDGNNDADAEEGPGLLRDSCLQDCDGDSEGDDDDEEEEEDDDTSLGSLSDNLMKIIIPHPPPSPTPTHHHPVPT